MPDSFKNFPKPRRIPANKTAKKHCQQSLPALLLTIILVNLNLDISMKTLPLSEVKMKLSALVDAVSSTEQEVVITKNGRPVAVLVSPAEFESWQETLAVKSDTELMAEIKKGLTALKKKQVRLYSLEELCA